MANELYQYSIISALMDGVATGGVALSTLQERGTYGLGTFENIEGEMVMIDGAVHHLRADGSVEQATSTTKLPFAMVTRFEPTARRKTSLPDKDRIIKVGKELFPNSNNCYLALHVEATFKEMTVRAVRSQTYKGQPLSELGSTQSVHTYKDVRGTVFGFQSPPFSSGISVAGGHLHFLSADRDRGGHVLALQADEAVLSGASIRMVHIELPESSEFNDAKLDLDQEGIRKIEG
jgi:alpha-acetolactate decarboxylase